MWVGRKPTVKVTLEVKIGLAILIISKFQQNRT